MIREFMKRDGALQIVSAVRARKSGYSGNAMDRLPQDTLHAMLLAAAMGSLAVVLRIVVARTHGRNWFTETLAGVAVLTVMAVLVLLVLGGRQ